MKLGTSISIFNNISILSGTYNQIKSKFQISMENKSLHRYIYLNTEIIILPY